MEELKKFMEDDDVVIRNAALDVNTINNAAKAGHLTREQAKELIEDHLEVVKVRKMSIALERKIKILQAFNAIRNIVETLAI